MSAGLAALAAVLQGVGEKAPGFVDKYNAGIASKNRGAILGWGEEASLTWAREQQKLRQLEQDAKAADVTLPEGGAEKRAVLADHGVDPDADLPFEKWVAKKRGTKKGVEEIQQYLNDSTGAQLVVDGDIGRLTNAAMDPKIRAERLLAQDPEFRLAINVGGMSAEQALEQADIRRRKEWKSGIAGEVAGRAEAAQSLTGGNVAAGQKETKRGWDSEYMESVRPQVTALTSDILSRKERGASDLDLEEERLRYQMGLLQPYTSQLDKEDLPALLKRIENIGSSRKERRGEDDALRSDQVRVLTGFQGADRGMTQASISAEARASEGDKNRDLKGRLERTKEAGRDRRAGAALNAKIDKMDRDELRYHQESLRKQIADRKRIIAQGAKLKPRTYESVEQAAGALGVDVADVKSFFSKSGKLDFTKANNEVYALEGDLDKANKEMARRNRVPGAGGQPKDVSSPKAGSDFSPGGSGWKNYEQGGKK